MTKKLICVIFIVVTICSGINLFDNKTYAADTIDGTVKGAQDFIRAGGVTDEQINSGELKNTSDYVFNALLAVAIVAAVIIGMIIGIQFMISGVDERAKVKEALVPYAISCVVIFGAFGIWKLAVNIMNGWLNI